MTVFLALDLDEAARARATAISDRFRAQVKASWVRADKLHLTLVFLGNPSEEAVRDLEPPLGALARRCSPFSLRLEGAGLFETARAPSVLWLGVGGDLPALHALQRRALEALAAFLPRDADRPFVPHVTLARAKAHGAFEPVRTALEGFEAAAFSITHLTLYLSTHDRYRPLARLPFGHAAGENPGP